MAIPISTPNLTRKNVLQSSRYERSTVIYTPFFKSLNKFGFLTLNNCADLIFNTFSTLKTMKMLGLCHTRKSHPFRVITWYNGRFYVAELSFKPEVLTPNTLSLCPSPFLSLLLAPPLPLPHYPDLSSSPAVPGPVEMF